MNRKGLILLFSMLFFGCALTFSQDKAKDKNQIAHYNTWLRTIQLDKLLQASTVGLDSAGNTLLTLTPSPDVKDIQDLATNWKYVRLGLKQRGISIYDLLWFKWVDYAGLSPAKLRISVKTSDPSVFSLELSFDGSLQIKEQNNEIRGGEISIAYNFNDISGLVTNISFSLPNPLTDLNAYYPLIAARLKQSKHMVNVPVVVRKLSNAKEVLQLEVSGMYGEATKKKYHEKAMITLILNSLAKPQTMSCSSTVLCSGGILNPGDFTDASAEPELRENLRLYNQNLVNLFKSLFYGKTQ